VHQVHRGRARLHHAASVTVALLLIAAIALGIDGVRTHERATGHDLDRRALARDAAAAALASDGVDRVLFVGDSLTFGAHDELEATFLRGGIETSFVGYPGTGLLSGRGMWLKGIDVRVRDWHPDVVVIEACCNYANGEPPWRAADGHDVAPDSDEMYELWQAHAEDAVRRASAGGAQVRWVVTPHAGPNARRGIPERIVRFEAIAADLGVGRIDWRATLEPDGRFTRTMQVDGRSVAVRKDDGLHFTDAGDALVAAQTWRDVAPLLGKTP
jgi:hypothetical protein